MQCLPFDATHLRTLGCVVVSVPLYFLVFPCIPLYSFVFPCIPLYSFVFLCIPLYSLVFPCIPRVYLGQSEMKSGLEIFPL